MKHIRTSLLLVAIFLPLFANAGDGYKITGKSGVMYFVAIDSSQQNNEDIYRYAVGEACAGKAICQVQYWVGSCCCRAARWDCLRFASAAPKQGVSTHKTETFGAYRN